MKINDSLVTTKIITPNSTKNTKLIVSQKIAKDRRHSKIDGDHISELNSVNFFTEIDFYEAEIKKIKENQAQQNQNDNETAIRE